MKKVFAIVLFFSFIFSSCMTMADYDFSSVDAALISGDFFIAKEILDQNSNRIYSNHDEILELLDKGILLHFDARYEESNDVLSAAEKLMVDYRAKSITQTIGSALINDTVTDYAGEDFEDIYTNIFMCLNYIALNMNDDAMVEIRRFDNKMKSLGSRYQAMRAQLENQIQDDTSSIQTKKVTFHNSALARYLSMILYRSDGSLSDAGIDLKNIEAAFKMQSSLYNFSAPTDLQKELGIPSAAARINFVAFSGFAPIKQEQVLRIPLPSFYYKLALPVMQSRPSSIASIKIKAISKSGGGVYQGVLSKIESIDNIAKDTFNDRYGAIVMKTLVRSIAKAATGTVLRKAGENENNPYNQLGELFGVLVQVSTEFTERADVRSSRYFPGSASVGSIDVPPGTYDLHIDFCATNGRVLGTSTIFDFKARAGGALNLAEAVCYR